MARKLFRTKWLLVLTAIISLVLLISGAAAVSATPKDGVRFLGVVTLDGNDVVPTDDFLVFAWIDGSATGWFVNPIRWPDGPTRYALDIPADNPQTPQKDGGSSGDVVHFLLVTDLGEILAPTAIWPDDPDEEPYVSHHLRLVTPPFYYILAGDANEDGAIDSGDIIKVQRIILGLDPPTFGADANMDGTIDSGDIVRIMLIILGLYP